jgi:hypothetical protein
VIEKLQLMGTHIDAIYNRREFYLLTLARQARLLSPRWSLMFAAQTVWLLS